MFSIVDLKKFTPDDIGRAVLIFTGTISPGILVIWLFNPVLVTSASTPKLILLSCSFMLPYFSVIAICQNYLDPDMEKEDKANMLWLSVASVYSMAIFSLSLLISFILNLSLGSFVLILILASAAYIHDLYRRPQTEQQQHGGDNEQNF